ncbi:NMS complex subunit spc7 [Hyphodiscus hymeniophilus]|uniref:NMS complex subunit spc7 n=1 Tax=Hyphodiscus hymeniophilus TaxID=353542 RepID=A0A9P6SN23_9HELO|nr:NMS complex subunit spc7 [Hyphodiscus hymeniophilus]
MSSREEITLPATRPKSRKSLAHIPSSQDMDQENMTADYGALAGAKKLPKKSRSKSIGPGGLDALKDAAGNRRKSLASVPHPTPKSILKPTMPPLREIPAHISARTTSPKKSTLPSAAASDVVIDFGIDTPTGPTVTGADSLPNPFRVEDSAAVNETRVTLRTEEEQHAASREREERERKDLEKEINSRRDARRKSLANRRVSFAPEATLHTWDVVVEYQDSTTSSNSTNSTRRASSTAGETHQPQIPGPVSPDPSEAPSTPPEQVEEQTETPNPAHQRDLHQKKRRRSSGIPPMNFNNPEDEAFSSSPFSGSSADEEDELVDAENDEGSTSNSGSEDDDGTTMSIDGGETTDMSMASFKSGSSGSSFRLEEALRLASRQAGTQGIDFDEHGDAEMAESEDGEVIASFAPFKTNIVKNLESKQDQENVNPFSPAFKAGALAQDEDKSDGEEITMEMTNAVGGILPGEQADDDEMSMDVTRAFGSIISNEPPKTSLRRKSVQAGRRQSTRRRSSGERSSLGDVTMDLTVAMGGIQPAEDETDSKDDEDMTMEFTSIVGGVLPQGNLSTNSRRRSSVAPSQKVKRGKPRESLDSAAGDDTMDITVAMGRILPSITESSRGPDATLGMDMTNAVEGVLPRQLNPGKRTQAKKVMELETDLGSSPFQAVVATNSPREAPVPVHTIASETGSPSMAAFRGKGIRRSTDARHSTTPKSKTDGHTPVKKPTTPSKQITPQSFRPTSTGKTPPSKNVVMRTSSPRRLFKDEIKVSSTPQSSAIKNRVTPSKLFQKDKNTGVATPNFVLTPQRRVSSGIGIDKEGLGSPRVASLLDRRGSIGDHARSFVPSLPNELRSVVTFHDPRAIEEEIDREREQEENRENGRKILEVEADQAEDENDATFNLKEMIQTLTPKKKSLKGRKSLHVGAAKGILGKRPIELDEDEEEEDNGMKRIKGHQSSPVKNVKLRGPPSKAETTGRMTRATRKSLEISNNASSTPKTASPEQVKVTTPRDHRRFKDAEVHASHHGIVPFAEKEAWGDPQIIEESNGEDRIQLQDFLNLTSIRFMELTTTKRRHTIAHKTADSKDSRLLGISLEDCVAAGAVTIPMLELFQHACHELKSYISEGRKTIREIETETFEENPPLFREYISAPADIKVVMDNQLKNVKTHARLRSKSMWYEWRLTLLETLRDGFFKTADGMEMDEDALAQQQTLLDSVLPRLVRQLAQLEREEIDLQSSAEELANCDQAELSEARQQLITYDADIEAKKLLIVELSRQLQGKEAEFSTGVERKEACLEDIRNAEKIREECRGWTSNEISALKAKVDDIEKEHGWTVTGVSGTTISMTYRKEIELVFDASSFQSNNSTAQQASSSRIDLWYIAGKRELCPLPLTQEKEFFLQSIRDHIRGLPQARTQVKDLLDTVSKGWNKANVVGDNIRLLKTSNPTDITKTSDNSVLVTSMLLIASLTTKVQISFHLTSHSGKDGISVEALPNATVIYGERFNEPKMREFLLNRCGNTVTERAALSNASWGAAVAELGDKLLARGRK